VVNADQVAGGKNYPCFSVPGDCVGIFGTATTSGFAVSYTGAAINNAHWIQVLATNSPANGQTSPYVDNNRSNANPYYDVEFNANATVFLDAPFREPTVSQYWLGNLYYSSGGLAAGTKANPTQVTIYNGLQWGWADIFVKTSNFAGFLAAINSDFNNVANLDVALGVDLTAVLNQDEINQLDVEFNAVAVPEPSFLALFLCGLFVIAAAVIQWRAVVAGAGKISRTGVFASNTRLKNPTIISSQL
jgi:hypothetical protein